MGGKNDNPDGDSAADATAPNQYQEAMRSARPGAVSLAHELEHALDKAVSAMGAGAWQSSTSPDFEHALSAHRSTLRLAGDSIPTEFGEKIGSEPERVATSDWRATFFRTQRLNRN